MGAVAPISLGVKMRDFVAKHARTYNKAHVFIDKKKASRLIWDEDIEPPYMF